MLYLNKGTWHGKQLVPAAWVAVATARQTIHGSATPTATGSRAYCYQFWRARHNIYRGDGAFGQFCIVMPDQDAVVAITSGTKDMAAVMNLVWDKLLPAMKDKPLPPDPRALNLKLPPGHSCYFDHASPVRLGPRPASPRQSSGHKYVFPANDQKLESAALSPFQSPKGNTATLALQINGVEQKILCGDGAWRPRAA